MPNTDPTSEKARSVVTTLDEAETRAKIAAIDAAWPDFDEVFTNPDLDSCCRLDEVAHRHGWGEATRAWESYDSLRWLLGDR